MENDIFGGGPFDFNNDGHTDPDEEWFGLIMANELRKKRHEPSRQSMNGLNIAQTILGIIAVISAVVAIAQLFGG